MAAVHGVALSPSPPPRATRSTWRQPSARVSLWPSWKRARSTPSPMRLPSSRLWDSSRRWSSLGAPLRHAATRR
eukprot:scaffold288865_cov41-Tisochrysis_lutea.AAC.1